MKYYVLYGKDNRPMAYSFLGICDLVECGAKLLFLAKNQYKIIWN